MTFALLFGMLLFLGFCAAILAMGISDIYGNRESEKSSGAQTTRTGNDDRDRRA
jgi:hypothetical protein